jgi:hypothetical protein
MEGKVVWWCTSLGAVYRRGGGDRAVLRAVRNGRDSNLL